MTVNKTILDYDQANSVDSINDQLLIYQNGTNDYRRISRNSLLDTTGSPMDISSTQTVSNKTLDNTNIITTKDSNFTMQDDGDVTRQAKFQLSGITAGQTRTYTLPDASSTLVDLSTAQTLINKTLTSPSITTTDLSVLSDATISGDLTVTSDVAIGGVLSVTGVATFTSNPVLPIGSTSSALSNANLNTTAGDIGGTALAWIPTLTGWSSNPANGLYYYTKVGKFITLFIRQPTNGTSDAATCVFTLPETAVTRTSARWTAPAEVVDNNVALTTPGIGVISSAGTTLTVAKSYGFEAFTTSGNKRVNSITITYETA